MKESKSTNPEIVQLIRFLKKQSHEKDAKIWRDAAKYLAKTRQHRATVNLSRINRHTRENDIVVVPGKILGSGAIDHAVTVASLNASAKAKEKLAKAEAIYISIPELVEKNPKGSNVKIIR
jgi:large subunit ribosomal protein L18e